MAAGDKIVLPIHGADHCPGGPDEIPCLGGGGTSVVHFFGWNYDSIPTVADSTITPICNFSAGKGYYEEVFVGPAGHTDMTYDHETGIIEPNVGGMYMADAWVQFEEDAQHDDEYRRIAIERTTGGAVRRWVSHAFEAADSGFAGDKFTVATSWLAAEAFTTQLRVVVFHNAGIPLTINSSEFTVRRFELEDAGEFVLHDPFA